MRLRVRHHTAYRYAAPVAYAIQTIKLTPRSFEGLNVLQWSVRAEATRRELPAITDGYGNVVHCHTVTHLHDSTDIIVEGEVETRETHGVVRGALETLPPLYYLRATALTQPDAAIATLVAEAPSAPDALGRLHALMGAVRRRVEYRLGATHVLTPAADALAAGAGVCQDHAHLFLAAARLMGFAARYVSGYLWTGEDGFEASHAWAEAHVPDLGWVGFDVANGVSPTEAYIRAAIGLDYWSAAPVRGVRRGGPEERLSVSVQVQQAAAEQ